MIDTRRHRTKTSICEAFLVILGEQRLSEISMSNLADRAGVSRSTLYSHFKNTHEVFVACVSSFSEGITPLKVQLRNVTTRDEGVRRKKQPFCVALQDAGIYSALVREPSFLQTFLELTLSSESLESMAIYNQIEHLTNDEKRSIICFQLSGCYSAALNSKNASDWERNKFLIDSFIRSGIHALR